MSPTLSQSLWSGHCNLWRHGLTLKLIFLSFFLIWTLFWIELLKWWSRDGDQERQGKGVSWRTNCIFIICLDWIFQTYLGMNFIVHSEFAKAIFSRWVKARLRKTKIKFELSLKPIFFSFSFWIKHATMISLIEITWQQYYRIIIYKWYMGNYRYFIWNLNFNKTVHISNNNNIQHLYKFPCLTSYQSILIEQQVFQWQLWNTRIVVLLKAWFLWQLDGCKILYSICVALEISLC